MTAIHIMLDLETWGKKPGCDIRSIGACVFDPVAGIISDFANERFYTATDNPIVPSEVVNGFQNKRMKYPLARDPETVQWWNDQSPAAQAAFAMPVDLRNACSAFGHWIAGFCQDGVYDEKRDGERFRIWANDPHFDVSILDAVYDAVGLSVPWHYRSPRSVRTVCDLAGMTRDDYCSYGVDHHSLDDAIAQAMTVCEAYKRLGLQK